MSRTRSFILFCLVALMLGSMAGLAARAPSNLLTPAQNPTITVAVEPSVVSMPVGGTTEVRVDIQNPANLIAFEIRLAFDPSVIQIGDGDPDRPGVQVRLGSLLDGREYFPATNLVDNEAGTMHVAVTLLGVASPINESGDLVTMLLSGTADGISPLTLTTVLLADTGANMLTADLLDGVVFVGDTITLTPSPTSTITAMPPSTPTPTEAAASVTPTQSVTATNTPTATATASRTPTVVAASATPSPTATSTGTAVPTPAFQTQIHLPLMLSNATWP